LIWRLHTTLNMKIGVMITLLTGSVGLITSILRCVAFSSSDVNEDSTWVYVNLSIYTIVEPSVYLIASCLPVCRPLLMIIKQCLGINNRKEDETMEDYATGRNDEETNGGRSRRNEMSGDGRPHEMSGTGWRGELMGNANVHEKFGVSVTTTTVEAGTRSRHGPTDSGQSLGGDQEMGRRYSFSTADSEEVARLH